MRGVGREPARRAAGGLVDDSPVPVDHTRGGRAEPTATPFEGALEIGHLGGVARIARVPGRVEKHGGAFGGLDGRGRPRPASPDQDRKSTRLNSSHGYISYAVFCLKKKKKNNIGIIFKITMNLYSTVST